MKNQYLKTLFIFVLFSSGHFCFAQVDTQNSRQDTTLIFKLPGYAKDPIRSKLQKTVVKKDSLWFVQLKTNKGNVVEEISYADENLEVRKGPYAFYQDGVKTTEGQYEKGYKMGRWKFFDLNGQLRLLQTFKWDKPWGIYRDFYPSEKVKTIGQYINNKKIGTWHYYNEENKLVKEEAYTEQGTLIN